MFHTLYFTCYAQQYAAQRHPTASLRLLQEFVHVVWGEGLVDMGVPVDDIVQPDRAYAEKPRDHDGREEESYTVCPVMLQREQEYEYCASNRHLHVCQNQPAEFSLTNPKAADL